MPIYTYRCRECDHQFEKRQRMSDEPLTVCPVCEGRIRRVVNSVGVVFKGSGFYVTDNRGKNSTGGKSKTTSTEKSKDTETESPKKTSTTPENDSKRKISSSAGAAAQ